MEMSDSLKGKDPSTAQEEGNLALAAKMGDTSVE